MRDEDWLNVLPEDRPQDEYWVASPDLWQPPSLQYKSKTNREQNGETESKDQDGPNAFSQFVDLFKSQASRYFAPGPSMRGQSGFKFSRPR